MVGVLLGSVLSGQSSELFGRKLTMYSFNLFHILANVVTAFSTNWIMFASLRFIVGVAMGGIMVVAYSYPIDFLPIKWRPVGNIRVL